jgi:hypothetical protein
MLHRDVTFRSSIPLLWLALAAMALRGLVGDGFMLGVPEGSKTGALSVVLCGGLVSAHEHEHSKGGAPGSGHIHALCPYAVGAAAALPHVAVDAFVFSSPESGVESRSIDWVPASQSPSPYLSRGPPTYV